MQSVALREAIRRAGVTAPPEVAMADQVHPVPASRSTLRSGFGGSSERHQGSERRVTGDFTCRRPSGNRSSFEHR
jgi:hypothetical protein